MAAMAMTPTTTTAKRLLEITAVIIAGIEAKKLGKFKPGKWPVFWTSRLSTKIALKIATGTKLKKWVSQPGNLKFLTSAKGMTRISQVTRPHKIMVILNYAYLFLNLNENVATPSFYL